MIETKVQEFLWGVRLNNERAWFENNKAYYTEKVAKPLKELAQQLWTLMEEAYQLGTVPHVSRIYRDARRLFGRGPYKDHLWVSLRRGGDWTAYPTFFFEITPDDWSYGMVWAFGRPDCLQAFRDRVYANPAEFDRLAEAMEKRGNFYVWGPEYKRRFAAPTELSDKWLSRKAVCFIHEEKWNDRIAAPDLAEQLFRELSGEIELYRYFTRIADAVNGG